MTRVIHVGLGPIGRQAAAVIARRAGLTSVAGLETDPALVGHSLAELVPGAPDAPVVGDASALPAAEVAVICTTSRLAALIAQAEPLLAAGLHVVSTCEELVWPHDQPALAQRLDAAAQAAGRAVLGVGVNPGFLMDLLPVVASGLATDVTHMRLTRRLDLKRRRAALQAKNGVGRPLAEVQPLAASGALGHVGLPTSARLLGAALGWELTDIAQTNTAVAAGTPLEAATGTVAPGSTTGILQRLTARDAAGERIAMELLMTLADVDEIDEARLATGDGELVLSLMGVNGDTATAAIVANAIPTVVAARPGLRTLLDMPPLRVGR